MAINDKDFVKINYTGKTKETGDIFDTTLENVAKENGITLENKDYQPLMLAVGSDQLIPKLQEAIKEMAVGEEKTIEIVSDDAYGPRDPSLIQLIPMKEFKKQNIRPFVGMPLTLEGTPGIVRTVNGGRVQVDFNHTLAGKDLIFNVEIVETINNDIEKIKGLLAVYYRNPNLDLEKTEVEIKDGIAKIKLDKLAGFDQRQTQEVTLAKFRAAKEMYENIDSIDKVQFIDEYEPAPVEEGSVENTEEVPEVINDGEE